MSVFRHDATISIVAPKLDFFCNDFDAYSYFVLFNVITMVISNNS